MLTLVVSRADPASLTIRDALLDAASWKDAGALDGLPVREGPVRMVEIEALHLHADELDARLARAGLAADALVFASRHQSAAGRPSLTVHPVGNWGEAEHGGRAGHFSPAPARLMASLLRALAARAPRGTDVTYEATHHGPFVGVPACFLEIGSAPDAWRDPALGKLVAEAFLEGVRAPAEVPVLLALGGGHYQPKATDLARRGRAAFAHMLPKHHLGLADIPTMTRAVAASPGATGYFLDERDEANAVAATAVMHDRGLVRFG